VPTDDAVIPEIEPLIDTLAEFVSLTVVDTRGLIVAPVPEE
jgi:hypothetical protein